MKRRMPWKRARRIAPSDAAVEAPPWWTTAGPSTTTWTSAPRARSAVDTADVAPVRVGERRVVPAGEPEVRGVLDDPHVRQCRLHRRRAPVRARVVDADRLRAVGRGPGLDRAQRLERQVPRV